MKVIFLDIDGVLNTGENRGRLWRINNREELYIYNNMFCRRSLKNLKKIQSIGKAYIVLHSSRRDDKSDSSLIPLLEAQFLNWGLHRFHIGMTPRITGVKEEEIKKWLADNTFGVNSFVILDDEAIFEELVDHWVECNPYQGITDEVTDKAIAILFREEK